MAIASVPVLKGTASDRFEQQMKESESRRGSVDFTSIETARKILAKANISDAEMDAFLDGLITITVEDIENDKRLAYIMSR